MSLQDGVSKRVWKPGLVAAGRRALDLILPPMALDGGPALSPGLTAEAWSRIAFIDDPVCDGCGQPFILIMKRRAPKCTPQLDIASHPLQTLGVSLMPLFGLGEVAQCRNLDGDSG